MRKIEFTEAVLATQPSLLRTCIRDGCASFLAPIWGTLLTEPSERGI